MCCYEYCNYTEYYAQKIVKNNMSYGQFLSIFKLLFSSLKYFFNITSQKYGNVWLCRKKLGSRPAFSYIIWGSIYEKHKSAPAIPIAKNATRISKTIAPLSYINFLSMALDRISSIPSPINTNGQHLKMIVNLPRPIRWFLGFYQSATWNENQTKRSMILLTRLINT